jgi:AcrR family transcriptional regulator
VSAAAGLGVHGLTMQAVADELGVSDAALYHHFESRDALISAVVDANVRTAPFPEDRGQDWQAWMGEFAEALRTILTEHPGSARFAAVAGPTSPEQVRLVARAIGVLTRCGFDENEAAMIYSLVTNYVVSSVQIEERRALAQEDKRDISARFSEAVEQSGGKDSAALRKVAKAWAKISPDERFRYGLHAIINGIGHPSTSDRT